MKCLLDNCHREHDEEEILFWRGLIARGVALHSGGHHLEPLRWKARIGAYDDRGFYTDERSERLERVLRDAEREWNLERLKWPRNEYEWKRLFGLVAPRAKVKLDKEEIRRRIVLSELVGQHTRLRMIGHRGMGKCPFHEDRLPSFSVDDQKGVWHCHAGCGGGDVFTYVMKRYEMNFREALNFLGDLIGSL